MPSEARQKKIMEKLNRAQKFSILGPQNLGSRWGPGPWGPPWIRACDVAHSGICAYIEAEEGTIGGSLCIRVR